MKKLTILVLVLLGSVFSSSCLKNEYSDLWTVLSPKAIDSIQVVEILPANEVTLIKTFYTRKKTCEFYYGYDYNTDGNSRTIKLIVSTEEGTEANCHEINEVAHNTLQFKPTEPGTYTLHFWAGANNENEAMYITKEIEIP